jgi:hypothetical protein
MSLEIEVEWIPDSGSVRRRGDHSGVGPATTGGSMYDVVYLDGTRQERVLASRLERDSAVTIARAEARRLRAGRMFLAGSETLGGQVVVIVPSTQRQAAA